jgi:hypothetical protein
LKSDSKTSLVSHQQQVGSVLIENENAVNHDVPVVVLEAAAPRSQKEQEIVSLGEDREAVAAVGEQGGTETDMPVETVGWRAHSVVQQFDWQNSVQNRLQV